MDPLSDLRNINLPFDVDQVAEQCHKCVRKQLKKYEKFIDKDGKSTAGRFLVPCKGVLKEPVDPSLKSMFPEGTWDEVVALRDIVKWAEKYLKLPTREPWIARWYQAEVLRCTSRRKMLRISRRAGKTDLVCVEVCYNLFANKNIKIVIAGPQKTHAEEIIKRVRAFIYGNPELAAEVIRDVSAPYYEIALRSGSRVRGFAAGTKGKGDGVGIRGQDADLLYMEEMDYIDDGAINGAVLPLLQTSPNTSLVGFSTPSGFKTPFYNYCENNIHYVEFHHTYKVLPHWKNVEMERGSFTEEQWTREYLAEWGSTESGVYKPSYIDRALHAYKYEEMFYSPVWKYCIGTDWNEKYGTEIFVLGCNAATGKFKAVDALHVERSEFTQLTGVQKLLEMNKKWRPAFIYIDAGNGSTNYELLMKTAKEQSHRHGDRDTARLAKILKKYDAGSSVPVKDPLTGQEKKVSAKPFMVNASIRMFEQGLVELSSADRVLEDQLRSYIIERYTPTKTPVYGLNDPKVGDHRLDAFNLAVVAFQLEFDDLHTVKFVASVASVVDPRKKEDPLKNRNALIDQGMNLPSERRLEENMSGKNAPFGVLPGRISQQGMNKTNRLGWHTDTEDVEYVKYLQRKRQRNRLSRQVPRRSTF